MDTFTDRDPALDRPSFEGDGLALGGRGEIPDGLGERTVGMSNRFGAATLTEETCGV